jgi:hypothetical protein
VSQAEYEAAKDIVLDLLGWGVEPEYLVDLGLSREVVFYVFTELNLRLPVNLDVEGLSMFPPEEVLDALDWVSVPGTSQLQIAQTFQQSSNASGPASTLILTSSDPLLPHRPAKLSISGNTTNGPPSMVSPRGSMPHPSLPAKPLALSASAKASESAPLSAHAPPFVPTIGSTPQQAVPAAVTQDLNDMQAQRRRELLARKAAMSSLKPKITSTTSAVIGTNGSTSQTQAALTTPNLHAVDDFLNSLVVPSMNYGVLPPGTARMESPDAMDIDHDTPSASTVPLRSPPQITAAPALVGTDSTSSTSRSHSVASGSGSGSGGRERRTISPPSTASSGARRPMKRPTAADFIDSDPWQRDSSNGKPLQGFAGVGSRMGRCVIEFSDDEDDGNGNGNGEVVTEPSPPIAHRRLQVPPSAGLSGLSGPSRQSTRSGTPTMLAEKEREIEKMRQMIARKEQEKRMKKASGMGTVSSLFSLFRSLPDWVLMKKPLACVGGLGTAHTHP